MASDTRQVEVRLDVGNPPWVELKKGRIADRDKPVWDWMQDAENRLNFLTGGNQVAEAFAWELTHYLVDDGHIGLILPAMTLFKDESAAFRKAFFRDLTVNSVANFCNLAYVLFPATSDASWAKRRPSARSGLPQGSSTPTRPTVNRAIRFGCSRRSSPTNPRTAPPAAVRISVGMFGTSLWPQTKSKL